MRWRRNINLKKSGVKLKTINFLEILYMESGLFLCGVNKNWILLINYGRKAKNFDKDEINTLISLYFEFFNDENIGGKGKNFKSIISSNSKVQLNNFLENYPKNPYFESEISNNFQKDNKLDINKGKMNVFEEEGKSNDGSVRITNYK